MSAIRATGVGVNAGDAVLLDGVDLVVQPGELVALVGPNGAGKTTLLRVLAGDRTPGRGEVRLFDMPVADLDPARLSLVRSVFTPGGVSDVAFTVDAVVTMGRHPHRRDPANSAAADREVVADSMARTDVTHLAGRVVATLSSGEQNRVTLARVFAQAAPIVLLDEPTMALDVGHEERVMAEVWQLACAGTTVLAVLHDLNAAARWADRIVMLHHGRVRADGPPDEVLRPDLLGEVYGHPMVVVPHPFLERPLVLPDRPATWQHGGR